MRALLFSLALAVGLFAPPALASDVTVAGDLARDLSLAPGAVSSGSILLLNSADEPKDVIVYLRDYDFQADGTSRYAEVGTVPRSNSAWVTLTPDRLTVPARGEAEAFYTIRVPTEPGLKGTYWSIVMIEPAERIEAPVVSEKGRQARLSVRTVMRYGVQLVTDVGGGAAPQLSFAKAELQPVEGGAVLEVDVANTGELGMIPAVWVELFDPGGRPLGRFDGPRRRLLPGCSVRYDIPVGALTSGTFTALVVADSGGDYVVGSRYQLVVP